MKTLLWLAAVLVLMVSATSATLRLSQADVGCSPWPACYAQRAAMAEPHTATMPAWHEPVRLTHRISASVVGLMFVAAVLFGWTRWNAGERWAGAALLVTSLGLAWLGRYTPSNLPAVVLANLLGGHVLLAALLWLLAAPPVGGGHAAAIAPRVEGGHVAPVTPRAGVALAAALVALVLVQAASGGVVSARAAAAACIEGCAPGAANSWQPAAFNLWLANAGLGDSAAHTPARQFVLMMHVLGATLLVAAAAWLAWRARHTHRMLDWLPLAMALMAACLGLVMARSAYPLAQAVAHSVAAALTLAAAVALWRRTSAARAGLKT